MAAETNKNCERCGEPFHCGAALGNCDCFSKTLSPETKAKLEANYLDCVCLTCLDAIENGALVMPNKRDD